MSKDVILKFENVSKQYRLGLIGTGTLTHDLNRWWHKIRGKEDPFLKVGETNDRSTSGDSRYVWALKDINLEVERGEVLGIIGKNGAGKSTLLKILSQVTGPTTGSIKSKGRIASLLEVGTGFHPEMTGKENIYLNGAILGMTKKEITSKLDDIIAFSGCERYINTPVKRYSSGMKVRLAFAVAAHLEPDILVVDEVLAVGDAEFQKKAIGKMQDISKGQGRTVLFVSHNMMSVKSICTKALILEKGRITEYGQVNEIVDKYLMNASNETASFYILEQKVDQIHVNSIAIKDNGINGSFDIDKDLEFEIKLKSKENYEMININIFFNLSDGTNVFATCSEPGPLEKGAFVFKCTVPKNTLNNLIYSIDLMVVKGGTKVLANLKDVLLLEGIEDKRDGDWLGDFPGMIRPTYFPWSKEEDHE
jgi:lipopolysaccharide transport system ATP-binding protein